MADLPTDAWNSAKPYLDKNAGQKPKMVRAMRWLAYMRAADLPPWGGVPAPVAERRKIRQGVSFFACAGNRAATGSQERLL